MKPVRYALLPVSLLLVLHAGAQITLVSPGNVPINGRSYPVHRAAYLPPGPGGADMLFNFNTLAGTGTETYQWIDPATVPNGGQYPGAQFVLTNGGQDTVFYKQGASGLERVGDTQTITAMGTDYHLATNYTNNALDLMLPLSFQGTWTDLFSGTFTVVGDTTTGQRDGAVSGLADAWGRVVMPGGADTVEVLRVTTRMQESIPLTVSGMPLNIAHVHNETAFYPLWGKYPVMRIVSDTLTSLITLNYSYVEWLDASAVGVAEQAAPPLALHVFPNPAKDLATVLVHSTPKGAVDVAVYDVRGALVWQQSTRDRTLDLPVSQWDAGLYQLVATDREGRHSTASLVVE